MFLARTDNFASHFLRAVPLLLVCAAASLLSGCKGYTSAATYSDRPTPKPPRITLYQLPTDAENHLIDPRTAAPLTSPPWRQAEWLSLTAPANTTQTTAPTRGALFCDADTLYVFFISEQSPIPATRDTVSLFLDTSATAGDGRESVSVSVDSTGQANVTWFRATIPAEKRDDATPDITFPVHDFSYNVAGLYSRVNLVDDNGHPAWTAVLAIPFKNLPPPLKTSPLPGAHWKFNLIRNVTAAATDPGTRGEQFQSNFSPINVGAQQFTPQRLADLVTTP